MRRILIVLILLLACGSRAHAAPRFTYECDAPYLINLYWTVVNLTDPNSEHARFWERKFGLSAADREALAKLAETLQRLRGRYKVWESDSVLTPLSSGPMVGLFMAPMSSYEQRVQVAMATAGDLGTVRGRMPDLSFTEINTIAGTSGQFLARFDTVWESLARTPRSASSRVAQLLTAHQAKVDDFIMRAAAAYGVGGAPRVKFKVDFLWSPRATGGQLTLVENHIFCETSEREDPERYLLGVMHESCHYLSASVPSPTKFRRTEAMLSGGIYYPLTLVEESLASALAEGIAGKLLTPTLLKPGAQWVSHLDGRVDSVAKAIAPTLQRLFDEQKTLDVAAMREVAARCQAALAPRPRDFTTVCVVAGRKELRDYLRAGISQGAGLRYGLEYTETDSLNRARSELPAWVNRVYLVSAANDLMAADPLAMKWTLPLERAAFEELRSTRDRFIYTLRSGPRYEFVIFAPNDEGVRSLIDQFKKLAKVDEGIADE